MNVNGHAWIVPAVLAAVLCFFPAFAGSDGNPGGEKTGILALGAARVSGGDMAAARNTAISEALEKGRESYILSRLGSHGVVNNFQRLVREVIPRSGEEIQNFYILAEEAADDAYFVLVRIKINEKAVNDRLRELGILVQKGPGARVLIMVSEHREGDALYWWRDPEMPPAFSMTEIAFHNTLGERGFRPVNRNSAPGNAEDLRGRKVLDLGKEDALVWGEAYGADVVITGRCAIVDSKEASLTVEAYHVKSGKEIYHGHAAELIKQGGEEDPDRVLIALEAAVRNLAGEMAPIIIQSMGQESEAESQFSITLKGFRSFMQVRSFMEFLEGEVPGVTSVVQSAARPGAVSLDVKFKGNRSTFLNRVLNHENIPVPLRFDQEEGEEIVFTVINV